MNFESIKAGFISYLSEKLGESEENADSELLQNPSISIFMYSNEFKDYLVEETGADVSIFSKSISEIMQMDIVNGKLVDETEENTDSFMTEALNEAFADESVISALDSDNSGDLNEDEINIFLNSLSSDESGEISFDSLSEAVTGIQEGTYEIPAEGTTENAAAEESSIVDELLAKAYENKTVIKALDSDGDGILSDEEKAQFEEFIRGYDGDDSELSEDDIYTAITEIIKGRFSYEEVLDNENLEDSSATIDNTEDISSSTQAGTDVSSTYSTGGTWSAGPGSSSTSSSSTNNSLESKSLSELNTIQSDREKDVSDAQDKVNAVYSGENAAVSAAQEDYENAREAYDKAVENDDSISEELQDRRTENLNAIETQESTIDNLNINISDKDTEISKTEDTISTDNATLDGYKTSLSKLQSQSCDDEEKQKEIANAIANVQNAISTLESQIEEEKNTLAALESEKKDYEEQLSEAEKELTNLETTRDEIEKEILDCCSSETKEALEAYNAAKDNVESVKESELKTAKSDLEKAQAALDEVNEVINTKKEKEAEKEYSVTNSSLDSDLAEALDAKLGDGFSSKLEEICEEIGCNPEDLLGLMYSESGLNPSAVNSGSGATGLIQFMPSTAAGLGTSTSALKNMSAVEQLDYVEAYLKECNYYNYEEIDAGTLYAMVFLPGYANKDVLCSSGSSYYNSNKGLDINGDGQITKSDLETRVQNLYQTVLNQYT